MKRVKRLELERLLAELAPANRKIIMAIRNMIRRVAPDVEETVLWGGLSYHRPEIGGRVKGAVCQIGFKVDRVRLDFIHGIRLCDPHRLLRGKSVSKRFVPMDSLEDTKRPEIAELIREAASLDPSRWNERTAIQSSQP